MPMAMLQVIAGAVSEPRGRGTPPTKLAVAQLSEDWWSARASWREEMAVEREGVGGRGGAEDEDAEEELCFFFCAPESRGRSSRRNPALLRRSTNSYLNPRRTPGGPSMATSSA
eukprot:6834616-Pyramimonas_sp.AAC.1